MFPVLCFGQDELDSIAMTNRIDSIWQIARQQLEYMSSGNAKHDNKDFYGAISDYTKAIELYPDSKGNSGLFYFRGFSKFALGDKNGAISDYDKAIELKPDSDEFYFKRAVAKGGSEDHLGAILDATKAIELNPENAIAYKIRGLSMASLKYEADALKCSDYKKCCDLGDEKCCELYEEFCP